MFRWWWLIIEFFLSIIELFLLDDVWPVMIVEYLPTYWFLSYLSPTKQHISHSKRSRRSQQLSYVCIRNTKQCKNNQNNLINLEPLCPSLDKFFNSCTLIPPPPANITVSASPLHTIHTETCAQSATNHRLRIGPLWRHQGSGFIAGTICLRSGFRTWSAPNDILLVIWTFARSVPIIPCTMFEMIHEHCWDKKLARHVCT